MFTVFQFLGITAGAVLLLIVLLHVLERAVQRVSGERLHRGIRITASLGGALLILCTFAYGMGQTFFIKAVCLGGLCILLNRYWLGHFSERQHS